MRTPPFCLSLVSAIILSGAFPACRKATPEPSAPVAEETSASVYDKVEIGMRLREAEALLKSPGEHRKQEDLPVATKPLEHYPRLPLDTQWTFWTGADNTVLVLGSSPNDKIIYKQVVSDKTGTTTINEQIAEEWQ
jgi:hypothetical protein